MLWDLNFDNYKVNLEERYGVSIKMENNLIYVNNEPVPSSLSLKEMSINLYKVLAKYATKNADELKLNNLEQIFNFMFK